MESNQKANMIVGLVVLGIAASLGLVCGVGGAAAVILLR